MLSRCEAKKGSINRTWAGAAYGVVRNACSLSDIDASCCRKVQKTAPSDRVFGVIVSTSASQIRLASLQTVSHTVGGRQPAAAEHVVVFVLGPRGTARRW